MVKRKQHFFIFIVLCLVNLCLVCQGHSKPNGEACLAQINNEIIQADVCVYGGTASGVTAALAAARRGNSVVIIEPFKQLGGMHGGGIRIRQDCMYLDDIGGIAKELHDADFELPGNGHTNQWGAREMIRQKAEAAGIKYYTQYRLDSKADVVKNGTSIDIIHLNYAPVLDEGVPAPSPKQGKVLSIRAKVFIDASYEGDLMAFSGSDYTVGREAKSTYNESLAGQGRLKYYDIDPYIIPGDSTSGTLPMISTEPFKPGKASRYFLTYNFRLKGMQSIPNDKPGFVPVKPMEKKIDYERYELVWRGLKKRTQTSKTIGWPHHNYDRKSMMSGGIPGLQADYPDGDWKKRSEVWRDWINHVKTMNFLCGIENVKMPLKEYPENNGFPDQLYIRMGRRLKGEYTMTQHDLMHQTKIKDPIGLGYYAVDIYPPRLIAHKGKVASEGEVFVRVSPGPYQISCRSLLPKKEQCSNLIVSVCMSASHIAMASMRMESTYVVMGEAAGIMANHAIKSKKDLHKVKYKAIAKDMKNSGVITQWDGTGYGPESKRHWPIDNIYWKENPEAYNKIPIRLDPSWENH